jgi:hypothetical protein
VGHPDQPRRPPSGSRGRRWRPRTGASLTSEAPFPPWDSTERDPEKIHGFVTELLDRDIRIDSSRKQIAQDHVTWTMRLRDEEAHSFEVVAGAEFTGKLISGSGSGGGAGPAGSVPG